MYLVLIGILLFFCVELWIVKSWLDSHSQKEIRVPEGKLKKDSGVSSYFWFSDKKTQSILDSEKGRRCSGLDLQEKSITKSKEPILKNDNQLCMKNFAPKLYHNDSGRFIFSCYALTSVARRVVEWKCPDEGWSFVHGVLVLPLPTVEDFLYCLIIASVTQVFHQMHLLSNATYFLMDWLSWHFNVFLNNFDF